MARIRTVKPKFWDDVKIGKISRDARLLYIGMWNFCDDLGVIIAEPVWIKSKIFPYDQIQLQQFERMLSELAGNGFISLLSYNGERFFYLPNFARHQLINKPNYEDVNVPKEVLHNDLTGITERSRNGHGSVTEQSVPIGEVEKDREKEKDSNEVLFPAGECTGAELPGETNKDTDAGRKKKVAPKKKEEERRVYGAYRNVLLTEGEYAELTAAPDGEKVIDHFSLKKEMKGYKYKRDYLAILDWGMRSYHEERNSNGNRQLPAAHRGDAAGHGRAARTPDAADKRAELANLKQLAGAVLRGTSPKVGG